MSFNPVLPVTYNNATYLFGSDLNANFSTLMANDIDLNARINSIAGGYNEVDLEFTGASLSYSGATYVSGKPVFLTASAINATGAAGWRYAVSTDAGVVSIEDVPGGEITANTEQYTPEPVYNSTYNGYYSSVNPAKRIIGAFRFDGTNITEVIPYGSGKTKNDDWYHSELTGLSANYTDRLQFTSAFTRTRGTNISIVDNGAGTTDASGFRITAESSGYIIIDFGLITINLAGGSLVVACNLNGAAWMGNLYTSSVLANINLADRIHIERPVAKGDYFTFYVSLGSGSANFDGMEIKFRKTV